LEIDVFIGHKALTSDEELSSGTLVLEGGGVSMDGEELVGVNGALLVDGLTNDVDDSSEGLGTDRHHDGVAGVVDLLASDESFSGVEGNRSHVVASQMLGDFQNQFVLDSLHFKRIENGGQVAFELHIDEGTNDLGNLPHG